jgi:hypothetical protein
MASVTKAHSATPRRRLIIKSLAAGFATTAATYLLALACVAAQLHSLVVVLAWPAFALTRLLPPGELVTPDSPSSPWQPLAAVGIAWLIYSSLWYFWLGRRQVRAGA